MKVIKIEQTQLNVDACKSMGKQLFKSTYKGVVDTDEAWQMIEEATAVKPERVSLAPKWKKKKK